MFVVVKQSKWRGVRFTEIRLKNQNILTENQLFCLSAPFEMKTDFCLNLREVGKSPLQHGSLNVAKAFGVDEIIRWQIAVHHDCLMF